MPVLARVYHIPPRDQSALTLDQFHRLQRDHERMMREQEEG